MTAKRVKGVYKYFEKHSDEVPVRLVQTFTACIMNKPVEKVGPVEVEIFLKRHVGLMVACNKVKPDNFTRQQAMAYLDNLKSLNEEIQTNATFDLALHYPVCREKKLGWDKKVKSIP
jgi:hypothetical protein